MQNSKKGRPTVINATTVVKLVGELSRGTGVRAACRYAGISHEAYYSHIRKKGIFYKFLLLAEEEHKSIARLIVYDDLDRGSLKTSKWILTRYGGDEWNPTPI